MNNSIKGNDEVRLTPQKELWAQLPEESKKLTGQLLGQLKMQSQEDICYALLTWIKYKQVRPFKNPLLHIILVTLIELVEKTSAKRKAAAESENVDGNINTNNSGE